MGDTDNALEYLEDIVPLIGDVVFMFNYLESDIDHVVCGEISDRSDLKGLLVFHKMMYAAKVEVYERIKTESMLMLNLEFPDFKDLVSQLKECGTLRNRVVHARWHYTDDEGYTHVRFEMGKKGLEHELVQFSRDSLEKILEKIIDTKSWLDEFEEEYYEKLNDKFRSTAHDENQNDA
jgi:hypothetical protein